MNALKSVTVNSYQNELFPRNILTTHRGLGEQIPAIAEGLKKFGGLKVFISARSLVIIEGVKEVVKSWLKEILSGQNTTYENFENEVKLEYLALVRNELGNNYSHISSAAFRALRNLQDFGLLLPEQEYRPKLYLTINEGIIKKDERPYLLSLVSGTFSIGDRYPLQIWSDAIQIGCEEERRLLSNQGEELKSIVKVRREIIMNAVSSGLRDVSKENDW